MFTRKQVLILEYTKLPQAIKDDVANWHGFGNDRHLELISSYRLGIGPQTPEHRLKVENFKEFYHGVISDGEFSGTFDEFIKEYGFVTDYWLATSGQSFVGIDAIFVDINW